MAWYSDEAYTMIQDSREKKSIAASAFKQRTHCGKGGSVKFPSDYMTRKELKSMNGECIKYASLKKPMTWEEFKALPDDLKVEYIKSLREKFNVPDTVIAEMFDVRKNTLCNWFKCLGLSKGVGSGNGKKTWNQDGWLAWYSGASPDAVKPSETPVEAAEEENVEVMSIYDEDSGVVFTCSDGVVTKVEEMTDRDESTCDLAEDCTKKRIHEAGPIAYAGHHMPVIPKSGSMTFENNHADDALETIKCLLSNVRVNLTISWECVNEA